MKQIMICITSALVFVFSASLVSAADIQDVDKVTDKKKVTSPATKNFKSGAAKVKDTSTESQKKGDAAATTTKQSKQQHDRAKQTIDNLK